MRMSSLTLSGCTMSFSVTFAQVLVQGKSAEEALVIVIPCLMIYWTVAWLVCRRDSAPLDAWSRVIGAFGYMLAFIPLIVLIKILNAIPNGESDFFTDELIGLFIHIGPFLLICLIGAAISFVYSKKLEARVKRELSLIHPTTPTTTGAPTNAIALSPIPEIAKPSDDSDANARPM